MLLCTAGYPFDIPDPEADVLSYAALVYHLPLLVAFSVSQNTSFVWGGCMLFPAAHMCRDTYGIMQVLPVTCSDGGAFLLQQHWTCHQL